MKTMKRELLAFILYLMVIIVAEVVTSFYDPSYGLVFHSVLLMSLLSLSMLRSMRNPASNLFLSLSLTPLIRILSISLPLTFFPRFAWYIVASIPVFIAALTLMRIQGRRFRDVGILFKMPIVSGLVQVGIMLTGVLFGVVEYVILRPEPIVMGLSIEGLIVLAVAIIFSTGFIEEFVFRGIIQYNAVETLGRGIGTIGIAIVFAAMHIGWLSVLDILFVFFIGLFFGYCTLKTGSIVGISISHGVANVTLFIVMPLVNKSYPSLLQSVINLVSAF